MTRSAKYRSDVRGRQRRGQSRCQVTCERNLEVDAETRRRLDLMAAVLQASSGLTSSELAKLMNLSDSAVRNLVVRAETSGVLLYEDSVGRLFLFPSHSDPA